MDAAAGYKRFVKDFDGPLRLGQKLAEYSTFGTGGEADLFVDAQQSAQIIRAIELADESGISYFIMGGGSNLLISDRGYRGLIIRNCIRRLEVKDNEIISGAGEDLNRVVDFATECSLSGFEFAAGIWGTVGGAIYGNAGAFGSEIGLILAWAELIDKLGKVRTENPGYFEFTYRHSKLKQTREIVTQAGFRLESGDEQEIAQKTEEIRKLRCRKHPTTPCSAGCFFKNVEDRSQPHGKIAAGKLLEEVGAKELRVGGAAVFKEHANIIINQGNATSKDIRQLADIMKQRVKEKFGVELQEEVISLGEF